ncbi:MAG: hypothetical protein ACLR2E_23990 [Lachnospiraceae bacterium]
MKKCLGNNFGLKLLSVFVAILIWLMVVNVDDPEKTKAFVIPEQRIQMTNVEEAQAKAEQDQDGKKSTAWSVMTTRAEMSLSM